MGIASHTKRLAHVIMMEGRSLSLSKGEVIQSTETSDKLCYIESGYAKKYLILNDGNVRAQIIYGPGDIFPLTIVFKELFGQDLYTGPEVYYYETMSKAELITISKQKMVECIAADAGLYKDLFSEAGRRLYCNMQRLENLSLPTAYKRVAHQILCYADEFGEKKIKGTKIKVPLTQQDLADVLSTTRETVSLCMGELKKKHFIRAGKYIFVSDIQKLKTEAFE